MRPDLVIINFSGGRQSELLVRLVLTGAVKPDAPVVVTFADTGGEHRGTYEAVNRIEAICEGALPFLRCREPGLTLTEALLDVPGAQPSRLDQPALFFQRQGGTVGRAAQRCTRKYKVAPLRRAVRQYMRDNGIPLRSGAVQRWIGFCRDEISRAQKAVARQDVRWETLEFPLIRLGLTKDKVNAWYAEHGLEPPPRSLCVFCPAKTPAMWRATEQCDLEIAVAVDEAIRDLSCCGFDDPAYLSNRCMAVADIAASDVEDSVSYDEGCDAGSCFL